MTDILVTLLLVVVVIAVVYFLVKKFSVLVINAILGLIALFLVNFLHIMQWIGKPDSWIQYCNSCYQCSRWTSWCLHPYFAQYPWNNNLKIFW